MILRAIHDLAPVNSAAVVPAWESVDREQQRLTGAKECWMIPQPAHSALAGEMAAQLDPKVFPNLSAEVVRAIAMHDAGWGRPDAEAIQDSRGKGASRPALSFLTTAPDVILRAWVESIVATEKLSAIGGYMVSRHFQAIGKVQLPIAKDPKAVERFIAKEDDRQRTLMRKISLKEPDLNRVVEALQFCDLLSLYLCANPPEPVVEFPQQVKGTKMRLWRERQICVMEPSPFKQESSFAVSAIRHPKTKDVSSVSFAVMVR
jgi:hypothetical protein